MCNSVLSRGMTTITCKIPDKISAHLEATARQRRVPKSQVVREALAACKGSENLERNLDRYRTARRDDLRR